VTRRSERRRGSHWRPPGRNRIQRPSQGREFEFTYRNENAYFYVSLADADLRSRVRRKIGLKRGEILLAVRHFWISPKLRGKGLGKRLLQQLSGTLDALGHACALYAQPYDRNPLGAERLVKFYEKAGFKRIGTVRGNDYPGSPVMVRGAV
jgi:GNAT superfamily N-acetyltransferase